ncbi:abortive infection protein [Mycobacteroides abscessus subsp. abscessus]|nr:abortive infection protein [Mycobacteroides abscessus subsp. abscessus]
MLAFADYGSIAVVTAITLINGAAEELFFRGAVYSAVRPHHPVVVSTIVYTIATLASGNVMLGFAAILLGAVCAILRRCTGGVVAPICTHVVWSTIVLFALPPIFG